MASHSNFVCWILIWDQFLKMEKNPKPEVPPSPYKMHRLVAVTATILCLPCHRLLKDCMGKWKVSQNNSAETLKHKYALWTLQNNQVCGREEEGGSQLPCNPTEGCFPMGITHSTHPISPGSNPASGAPLVFGSCENRLFSGTQAVRWICLGRGGEEWWHFHFHFLFFFFLI